MLINKSNLSFIEFEVAEQDVAHVEYFVSIFKDKRGLNNFDFDDLSEFVA